MRGILSFDRKQRDASVCARFREFHDIDKVVLALRYYKLDRAAVENILRANFIPIIQDKDNG